MQKKHFKLVVEIGFINNLMKCRKNTLNWQLRLDLLIIHRCDRFRINLLQAGEKSKYIEIVNDKVIILNREYKLKL